MSTVAESCATDVCSALMSTRYRNIFKEVCEQHLDMQSWDPCLKNLAEEILKSLKDGKGISIDSLKPLITYASEMNRMVVKEFFQLRETTGMIKIADILGDEYMKMSADMLDFLNEMENFLMVSRKSHRYVAYMIQQYFEMEPDKRDAGHYKLIAEKLEKLIKSDNIYELSAESLLKKVEGLKSRHEELVEKMRVEIDELAKKEETARSWKNIASMICIGALVTVVVVAIVAAAIATTIAASTILVKSIEAICLIAIAESVTASVLEEFEMQYKNMRHANESRRDETRFALKELVHIKSSISSFITEIRSLTFKPDTAMGQEAIKFCMDEIKGNLSKFLNKIEDLEKQVEDCRNEVQKARDGVVVKKKTSKSTHVGQ